MRTFGGWCWVMLLVPGCGDDDGASMRDTGPGGADAGPRADSGPDEDAGSDPVDAGPGGRDSGPGTDAGPLDPSIVTVLTINLGNPTVHGMWPARRTMIADFIRANQPDLVAVQEATENDDMPNGAEEVAELVGYEHRFHQTHDAFLFREGIGALSRWPIAFDAAATLPHDKFGGSFSRAVLTIRVTHPEGELQLFATHLTTDSSETVKADQAVAILDFIEANAPMRAAFLGGDMNAEPDQLPMEVLRGAAMHDGRIGNLRDSWLELFPMDPGPTHPSDAPDRRIDYLYVVPGAAGAGATILGCEIVLDEPMGSTYASDHLGVMCRYDLE